MRSRDEVLREFGADELARLLPPVVAESVERMADRIRELERERDEDQGVIAVWRGRTERAETRIQALESQQAASEPVAVGNDGLEWPQTFDGMAWAIEFNKRFPAVSVDDALGWFCNAIMRGYDTYAQRHPHPSAAAVRTLVERIKRDLARYNSDDELQRIVDTAASERPTTPTRGSDE